MKNLVLIFLISFTFTCKTAQTQRVSDNKATATPIQTSVMNNTEHVGYARFTTSDKQYVGCWRSVEASEVVKYKLKFFRLTEKVVQTSKMRKSISYSEKESNNHRDYFVLQLNSNDKNNDLLPYLSINMISDDEMTMHEFATAENIIDGDGVNYWDLKRENCESVISKFRK